MEIERFWALIEGGADLTELPPDEIVAFARRYSQVLDAAYLAPLWAAAYLIEGGCGDDGFRDFRAGLMLQGRAAFEAACADPDSLADLPIVREMAAGSGWLGYEALHYAARNAYRARTGDVAAFDAALAAGRPTGPAGPARGERWDVEDEAENERRLPRLAALFQ
ncbi:DUF4240 domain-containing protein [Dactylosporangium sp. CA-139114]|uniref:DUF4240 domain-containing protein n=1 Tax=Dactylosporangium sp. CA-139114 TaxID=3239931 RepID=UPI003D969945